MIRNLLPLAITAFVLSSFPACKRSSNPVPAVQVGSPYTRDMCGSHLFHYVEEGNDPSHGSYSRHYDTTLSITYVNDTFVYFEATEFKCRVATDTIVAFDAKSVPDGGYQYTITYNTSTKSIVIFWGHSYEDHGTVYMGADSETWTSP